MAISYNPPSVTSGLVLALDAGNRKTFANSIINSTSWSLGSGSATGYNQNGATAENERVTGTDPFGKSATVWETRPQGNNADDGGWNSDWSNIDSTKLHRFSVWVKRTTSTSGGTFYFGLYGNNGIKRTDNSVVEGNPYWDCRGTGGFVQDVWYLVVGHCYPYNTTYTGQHPESGIYTVAGGTTKVASINACNIGADVKWAGADVTQAIHRCYHFYCSDSTTRLQFFDPRIDVIDGTEPSIANLLSGFTANRLTDLIGTINGTFVNSPTYSSANGGSIVFDGTNDYVTLSSSQLAPATGAFTWNFWIKLNDLSNASIIFSGTGSNTNYGVVFANPSSNGLGYYALGYAIIDNNTAFGSSWWYVTFTGNGGANGSRNLKLYRNGVQAGSTYTVDYNFASSTPIIGANHSSFAELMRGNISNVSYYNRELTAAEISQNFNALRSRFSI
jgi:hypothetical protein